MKTLKYRGAPTDDTKAWNIDYCYLGTPFIAVYKQNNSRKTNLSHIVKGKVEARERQAVVQAKLAGTSEKQTFYQAIIAKDVFNFWPAILHVLHFAAVNSRHMG